LKRFRGEDSFFGGRSFYDIRDASGGFVGFFSILFSVGLLSDVINLPLGLLEIVSIGIIDVSSWVPPWILPVA
jgi:hypothetical protein